MELLSNESKDSMFGLKCSSPHFVMKVLNDHVRISSLLVELYVSIRTIYVSINHKQIRVCTFASLSYSLYCLYIA